MRQLEPAIVCHGKLRTIECCLCGAAWEECLTAMVLTDGAQQLESICPACLKRGPRRTALLLGEKRSGLETLLLSSPSSDLAQLAARIAEVQGTTTLLCRATAKLLQRSAVLRDQMGRLNGELSELQAMQERIIARAQQLHGPTTPQARAVLDAASQADALAAVSDHLSRLDGWPVSVADAIAAEKAAFAERSRTGSLGKDVVAVIDARYRTFLRRAG